MDKRIDIKLAITKVNSGMSLMISGFSFTGSPRHLIKALANTEVTDLHTISDDLGVTCRGYNETISILVSAGKISSAKCSFIGENPFAGRLYMEGKLDIEFIPMGTFAERIRAGGTGLGGFYTPTGVGTMIEMGKETKIINGKKYILELPLHADVAFIKAWKADVMGNAVFKYTSRNYSPIMAMAADLVILEAEEVVDIGEIEPNDVQLPGVFVDYVVEAKEDIL